MPNTTVNIPTPSGQQSIEICPGQPLFILGRNGTGKSALINHLVSQLINVAVYLPGSRPSYFDNESLSLTPASRRQLGTNLLSYDTMPQTRWKSMSGTQRNEKAIHDLTNAEVQFKIDAANTIAKEGKDSNMIARLQSGESPLDRVNALLAQSNLPVTAIMDQAELKARRDGVDYSIAKMSDGERAALILISEIVAAQDNSVFIIDEPEIHLHPAIVVPLIRAILRERPECNFLISTHELELPAECPQAKIALIRGCSWDGDRVNAWEVDIIPEAGNLPEDLRQDVLGSRRNILFIEGVNSSLDQPLYSLLFPGTSVCSRETCREVERCVIGLRTTHELHRTLAFGLVDNDGMEHFQITALEAKSIYPLSVNAVESLYYSEELIDEIANRQSETFSIAPDVLKNKVIEMGLAALDLNTISHLASRVAERRIRDMILKNVPTHRDLLREECATIEINLASSLQFQIERLKSLRDSKNLNEIIARYPVKYSGVLKAIANALKFNGCADYERAALARVQADNRLQERLRAKLGSLALLLN